MAAILLGSAAASALVAVLKIWRLFKSREREGGRPVSREEFDKLLATVELIPGLQADVADLKATIAPMPDLVAKMDQLLARNRPFRATDRLPNA